MDYKDLQKLMELMPNDATDIVIKDRRGFKIYFSSDLDWQIAKLVPNKPYYCRRFRYMMEAP